MLKFISIVIFCFITITIGYASAAGGIATVRGTITDASSHTPLVGATISIPALRNGATTDADGNYTISNLPTGNYSITFSLIGYAAVTKSIVVINDLLTLDIMLIQSDLQMPTVTITATPQPTDVLTNSQSVSVIEGEELDMSRGQSAMQSLENLPSISLYTTGSAIAKPVVRGLTSSEVLVVDDGIRQEGQQWGDEHAPEVNAFDIKKIEVIRGPGSVLYGSDALGGVVHIVKEEVGGIDYPFLKGNLQGDFFSNNSQTAGSLSLSGGGNKFGFRGSFSARNSGNTATPEGELYNSGAEEINGGLVGGYENDEGFIDLGYSHFGTKVQFHEDPAQDPTATPYQRIIHDKFHFHAGYTLPFARLEAVGGYQHNWRREFEEENAPDAVLNLKLSTTSFELKAHHNPLGSMFGTFGFSVLHQQNETLGEEHLIAPATTDNIAGFIFEEMHLNPEWSLSAGARFDSRTLDVEEDADLGVSAQERTYKAFTGSTGISFRPSNPFAITYAIGRAWRAPTEFELFVNGVHEGTYSYEIGNSALEPELSLNNDLSFRYATPEIVTELTFYNNSIDHYIYDAPTGDIDTVGPDASGFDIFHISQSKATLQGVELSVQYQISSNVILSLSADRTNGKNDATGNPLPRIPAGKIILGGKLFKEQLGSLKRPFVDLKIRTFSTQSDVDPLEQSTVGYTLIDLGVGANVVLGNTSAALSLTVNNLFDRAYVNHLSREKTFALDPGRNIVFKISLPFNVL